MTARWWRTWLVVPVLVLADGWLVLTVVRVIQGERSGAVFWPGFTLVLLLLMLLVSTTVGRVRQLARRPDPSGRAPERDDLALLERYRPILRFDRQYDYRLLAVESAVNDDGNLLRRFDGEVIAGGRGLPALTLQLLCNYPGLEPSDEDCISMTPDYAGDARRWEQSREHPPCMYGRVVEDGGRTWLQYWFWLYYNPKNLFGFGKHEGDWEMVQLGLGADGQPEVATYAQHESGEARRYEQGPMDLVEEDGFERPVVYVAPYSHASYFDGGFTHVYVLGIDHPFGDGPQDDRPVVPFGDWVHWKGHWGNSERTIARRIGNGPRSPAWQGPKWDRPAHWHRRMAFRRWRVIVGKAMHALGNLTFPQPPAITEFWLDGDHAHVRYRLTGGGMRAARHLYLTVHDGDYVVASRPVRAAQRQGEATLRLPYRPGKATVYASAFNRVRQRSELAHLGETRLTGAHE